MFIEVCKSKIHRVTVTGADLQYVGSITIDEALMEAFLRFTQKQKPNWNARSCDNLCDKIRKLVDHCLAYGIDRKLGGVYCEGPNDGPARERNKEFWQQAESLIGFLDAYYLFRDEKYLDAYENIHRFVMDVMIHHKVGEWWPLFDENNNLLWTHMAHAWKINYHTMRSMIQSEARLMKILA